MGFPDHRIDDIGEPQPDQPLVARMRAFPKAHLTERREIPLHIAPGNPVRHNRTLADPALEKSALDTADSRGIQIQHRRIKFVLVQHVRVKTESGFPQQTETNETQTGRRQVTPFAQQQSQQLPAIVDTIPHSLRSFVPDPRNIRPFVGKRLCVENHEIETLFRTFPITCLQSVFLQQVVAVHKINELAGGPCDPGIPRQGQSPVRLRNENDPAVLVRGPADDLRTAIRRTVVDHDDLDFATSLIPDALQRSLQILFRIINRNHDAHFRLTFLHFVFHSERIHRPFGQFFFHKPASRS